MRKLMTLALVSAVAATSTGCTSMTCGNGDGCFDKLCRWEAQKNEALFGWMRPQQAQPQVVCYEGYAQPQAQCCDPGLGSVSYGTAPVITAPGACCGDAAAPTVIQPAPTPMPQ